MYLFYDFLRGLSLFLTLFAAGLEVSKEGKREEGRDLFQVMDLYVGKAHLIRFLFPLQKYAFSRCICKDLSLPAIKSRSRPSNKGNTKKKKKKKVCLNLKGIKSF